LLVMFSASKVGGSRGGTSLFFRAGTPSYTHHPKVQPGSSFIVHGCTAAVKYKSLSDLPKRRAASIQRESEKTPSRKPGFRCGRSRKAGPGPVKGA